MVYPPPPTENEKLPFSARSSDLQFNGLPPSTENEKLPFSARTAYLQFDSLSKNENLLFLLQFNGLPPPPPPMKSYHFHFDNSVQFMPLRHLHVYHLPLVSV